MPDAPQLPERRRRWLALSFLSLLLLLLLLLGASAWWFYPRGDARFVGKWALKSTALGYWDLDSNGLAVWHSGSLSAYTTWRIKDNILQMGEPQNTPPQKWRSWMLQQWNNLPFNKWIVDTVSFRILDVTPDKLILINTDIQDEGVSMHSAEAETLVRLPD